MPLTLQSCSIWEKSVLCTKTMRNYGRFFPGVLFLAVKVRFLPRQFVWRVCHCKSYSTRYVNFIDFLFKLEVPCLNVCNLWNTWQQETTAAGPCETCPGRNCFGMCTPNSTMHHKIVLVHREDGRYSSFQTPSTAVYHWPKLRFTRRR